MHQSKCCYFINVLFVLYDFKMSLCYMTAERILIIINNDINIYNSI